MAKYRSFTVEFLKSMKETHKLGKQHNLEILASSVAFLSIFSLCPLLILSYAASQYFLKQMSIENPPPATLALIINSIIPSVDPTVSQSVLNILRQNALSNIFNFGLLGWSVYELFGCLQTAFINISVRGNIRTGVGAHVVSLVSFLVVTGASTIFLMASMVDPVVLRKVLSKYLGGYQTYEIKIMAGIFGLAVITSSITFVYKLMPTQKIAWENAFRGSVLFIFLFFVGRTAYELYAKYYRFLNEGTFGPFFTFIMVIVWIYYIARIFLFSAQYAILLEERNHLT